MAEFSAHERFIRAAALAQEVQMVPMVEPQACSQGHCCKFPSHSVHHPRVPLASSGCHSNKALGWSGHVGLQELDFLIWSHLLTEGSNSKTHQSDLDRLVPLAHYCSVSASSPRH